jgi:hypothetical protein
MTKRNWPDSFSAKAIADIKNELCPTCLDKVAPIENEEITITKKMWDEALSIAEWSSEDLWEHLKKAAEEK